MPVLVPLALVSGIVTAVTTKSSTSFWLAVGGCVALFGWQLVVLSLYPLNERILGRPVDQLLRRMTSGGQSVACGTGDR